mmetsp:Transcript_18779/g.52686  ORF Transcript_18779/g.52686 Transcript_18779/m.52686 type:complete len:222 (-) Transcript_18779:369-1034(-)
MLSCYCLLPPPLFSHTKHPDPCCGFYPHKHHQCDIHSRPQTFVRYRCCWCQLGLSYSTAATTLVAPPLMGAVSPLRLSTHCCCWAPLLLHCAQPAHSCRFDQLLLLASSSLLHGHDGLCFAPRQQQKGGCAKGGSAVLRQPGKSRSQGAHNLYPQAPNQVHLRRGALPCQAGGGPCSICSEAAWNPPLGTSLSSSDVLHRSILWSACSPKLESCVPSCSLP